MFRLPEGRVCIMGVLNVTPDSFSDGGEFLGSDYALSRAETMLEEGADIIDVGGESTRPGAAEVPLEEEWSRVGPVITALAKSGVVVSIDTSKAEVARRALSEGAQIVNDVSALGDPAMPSVLAASECSVCLMHMQGNPRTMQASPTYDDVVKEVRDYLLERAAASGLDNSRIWLDPGIGFGKTVEHNLSLLKGTSVFVETGYPILIGVSRKSFIGKLLGSEGDPLPIAERLTGSIAAQLWVQSQGAIVVRTHDVAESVNASRMWNSILRCSAARV